MARKSSPAKTIKKPAKATNGKKKKKTVGSTTGLKDKAAVAKALFQHMCEEHAFGMTEWTREDLASALGFGNPRTEKFAHGLKMLIEQQGLAQKGGGKMVELSPKGIAKKPKDTQPTSLEAIHERYVKRLEDKVACGANNVRPLWKILEDRKAHTIDEIAEELGYKNKRSFMNTKVIGLMVKMGLVTKESSTVTMTDMAFPPGLVL